MSESAKNSATSMRRAGCVGLALAFFFLPIMAKADVLQDAFKAAFGQRPPIMHHANLPNWGEKALSLEPVLMVHVGGVQSALIVSETFNGAHGAAGDVAVSYLDHDSVGWRPIRTWYQFIQAGSFGTPFPRNMFWSFNFGGTPFFAGESEYCGMGACTRDYSLIGLRSAGPVDWGAIPASGSLESIYTVPDGGGLRGCGGYEYSSVISAPKNRGDIMRVTYTGWMIPGGNGQKRRDFQVSADVFLTHSKAKFRQEVQMPNCGS